MFCGWSEVVEGHTSVASSVLLNEHDVVRILRLTWLWRGLALRPAHLKDFLKGLLLQVSLNLALQLSEVHFRSISLILSLQSPCIHLLIMISERLRIGFKDHVAVVLLVSLSVDLGKVLFELEGWFLVLSLLDGLVVYLLLKANLEVRLLEHSLECLALQFGLLMLNLDCLFFLPVLEEALRHCLVIEVS